MPEATGSVAPSSPRRITLNSDGRKHPRENALTAFTLVIGIIAFAACIMVRAHLIATVLGLIGFLVGMYAQMISNTREQRIVIIMGVIAAGVGLGLGLAHGGIS